MEFDTLLTQIKDDALTDKINELLVKKKSGIELGLEPKIPVINHFVEETLLHFETTVNSFDPKKKPCARLLDDAFVKILDYCGEGIY